MKNDAAVSDYFDPSSRLFISIPDLFSWWWTIGFL